MRSFLWWLSGNAPIVDDFDPSYVPLTADQAREVRDRIRERLKINGGNPLWEAADMTGYCPNCRSCTGHRTECPRFPVVVAVIKQWRRENPYMASLEYSI